jgi:uncharacterized protein YgfB (UPF0149 family)
MTVAELHGGFCGLLCAGGSGAASAWLEQCVSEVDTEAATAEEVRGVFRLMELETWRALASADLEFTLLLPEDDVSLEDRVSELGFWCHGFLSGLGLGGLQLPEDTLTRSTDDSDDEFENPVEEIVKDFAAISRAGLSAAERNDSADTDFAVAEIVEYVRVSVQIVFEDVGDARGGETGLPVSLSEH